MLSWRKTIIWDLYYRQNLFLSALRNPKRTFKLGKTKLKLRKLHLTRNGYHKMRAAYTYHDNMYGLHQYIHTYILLLPKY